jgi:hypothetical protein
MAFFASLLAYFGAVMGMSIGALMVLCAFLAPPDQSTLSQRSGAVASKRAESMLRRSSPLMGSTTGRHTQSISARVAASESDLPANGASTRRGANVVKEVLRRRNSHRIVSRNRLNEWAYRHEPDISSPRANYAQDLSAGFSPIW